MLNNESHVSDIQYLTTLAGYAHWKLTGHKVVSVGEASGMFPIDSKTNNYDERMLELFNEQLGVEKLAWKLQDILPKVLSAGRPWKPIVSRQEPHHDDGAITSHRRQDVDGSPHQ